MTLAASDSSRPRETGEPASRSPMGPTEGVRGSGLEWDLAQRFLADAQGGLVGHPIVATLTLILFWSLVDPLQAGVWYGLLLLATLVRFLCSRYVSRGQRDPTTVRRLLFCGVSVVAAAWGLGGLLYGIQIPEAELGILLVIMTGLVAAGTTTLVAHGPSFYTFSSLLLGSVFAAILLRGLTPFHVLLLMLVVAFWGIMARLHSRSLADDFRMSSLPLLACQVQVLQESLIQALCRLTVALAFHSGRLAVGTVVLREDDLFVTAGENDVQHSGFITILLMEIPDDFILQILLLDVIGVEPEP